MKVFGNNAFCLTPEVDSLDVVRNKIPLLIAEYLH
jgi:hypothetical protein